MCTLRECGLYGILVAIGLTFTQPVGWGGGFKWCAGKCPLEILIFSLSFLFHFKPSSGNCLWFKTEISDVPANTSPRSPNLHFTHKNHFSQLRCLSKHQCVNQGKEKMQRMEKHAPGAMAHDRAHLWDSARALKTRITHKRNNLNSQGKTAIYLNEKFLKVRFVFSWARSAKVGHGLVLFGWLEFLKAGFPI